MRASLPISAPTASAVASLSLAATLLLGSCSKSPVAPRPTEPIGIPNPPFIPPPRAYPIRHLDPSWGPGTRLAYFDTGLLKIEGGREVIDKALKGAWLLDTSSGERRLLFPLAPPAYGSSWSPDGTRLVYSDYSNLSVVDATSGESRPLMTFAYPAGAYDPAWSPDGSTIAFTYVPPNSGWAEWSVRTVSLDGKRLTQIATGYSDPAWHPEGLVMHEPSGRGIYLWRASTGEVVKIRDITEFQVGDVAASPDGSRISMTPLGYGALWVMEFDGSNVRMLADHVIARHSWSRDGRSIAFSRDDWTTDNPENGVLWKIDVASGETVQLTRH